MSKFSEICVLFWGLKQVFMYGWLISDLQFYTAGKPTLLHTYAYTTGLAMQPGNENYVVTIHVVLLVM